MSETNAPEPTMEEILASIRRIISEDEPAASTAAESATSPGDPPEPPTPPPHGHEAPAHEPRAHAGDAHQDPVREDVLELTERMEVEAEETRGPRPIGDLDFAPAHAPHPEPRPDAKHEPKHESRPEPKPVAPAEAKAMEEPLVGAGAADLAADHFGALASSVAMPPAGRTLEDVTRELLRPLLKEWLDKHLAAIVEARVQDEVERISRRRSY